MNRIDIIIPEVLSKVSKVVNTGGTTPPPPSVVVHERQHAMNNQLDHAPVDAVDYGKVPMANNTTGVWEMAYTEELTGASGTFTTADSKTVTVLNGIITSIV